MKIFIKTILFISITSSAFSQQNLNCYTIIAGKDASFDGSVLVGHNEDDRGEMLISWFKVPKRKFKETDSLSLLNGTSIKQVAKTNSYLRFQVSGVKFGDAYLNEHSVTICSNACMSKEDTATGNIGYYFRRILAERAKTAREAVIIGGQLIEELGYESSGRTYTIADNNEAWMMSIVQGKRWVAQRIQDNEVAIIPNYYTIQEVDLKDSANYLSSPDIIDYAIKRAWYDTTEVFNFREVYGDSVTNQANYNKPRHVAALNHLESNSFPKEDILPFSFEPKNKVSINDIKAILSNHYEGTDYCQLPDNKNPHENTIRPICVKSTQFSFIAQLRSNMPKPIGSLIWISPYNGCIFPYIPVYFGIYNTNESIRFQKYTQADKIHFNDKQNKLNLYPNHAYYSFNNYVNYIEQDYPNRIEKSKIFKQKVETDLKRNQKNLEKSVLQVYESYPDDTKKILTEYCKRYFEDILNHSQTTVKQ